MSWRFVKMLISIQLWGSLKVYISKKLPGNAVLLAEIKLSVARLHMPFHSLPCSRSKFLIITDFVLCTIAQTKLLLQSTPNLHRWVESVMTVRCIFLLPPQNAPYCWHAARNLCLLWGSGLPLTSDDHHHLLAIKKCKL